MHCWVHQRALLGTSKVEGWQWLWTNYESWDYYDSDYDSDCDSDYDYEDYETMSGSMRTMSSLRLWVYETQTMTMTLTLWDCETIKTVYEIKDDHESMRANDNK